MLTLYCPRTMVYNCTNRPFNNLLIIGFSTRAVSESAFRSGYYVETIDFFGDYDQHHWANDISLGRDHRKPYSVELLVELALLKQKSNVIYTGNLENFPDLVEKIARHHRLIGNRRETIKKVRDWRWLQRFAGKNSVLYPPTFSDEDLVSASRKREERWLVKPVKSGGGSGVRQWRGEPLARQNIIQQFVDGLPCSFQFVSTGKDAVLLGITEQLIGVKWAGARPFQYVGNIFPLTETALREHGIADVFSLNRINEVSSRLADALVKEAGLTGLNGIDFILNEHGFWLLEVNPRPTAAFDLLERMWNISLIDLHCKSFFNQLPGIREMLRDTERHLGKTVLYAKKKCVVRDTQNWFKKGRRDIPWPNSTFSKHEPVCTVYAYSSSRSKLLDRLRKEAAEVYAELE
ncbi:MAG: ATP-grasp domain-containing protein [Candidatus Ranarchaeia archaeon]